MNEPENKDAGQLREVISKYGAGLAGPTGGSLGSGDVSGVSGGEAAELVRTQVYLSVGQRDYLQSEGKRRGISMAAALREIISESMRPAVASWVGNPLLDEVVEDVDFKSSGSGSESVDESVYGDYES